ncbi:hypothetical protein M378DRAFT_19567 [Amanita muscaria Koide BX008]|uniref:Uncharacterized protein n=1 Tax=Amanita muscaria (strain Koide BX008) TaxID=946122 RepID=A0A0C2VY61_AMAMK|nr:hypothetical protein M378DRAFT_19567 [Amanita muscaria Koide BX008]
MSSEKTIILGFARWRIYGTPSSAFAEIVLMVHSIHQYAEDLAVVAIATMAN